MESLNVNFNSLISSKDECSALVEIKSLGVTLMAIDFDVCKLFSLSITMINECLSLKKVLKKLLVLSLIAFQALYNCSISPNTASDRKKIFLRPFFEI